jgi:phage-related tail protein
VTAHLFASTLASAFPFTATMSESSAGYAFFAGDDMGSGFRFRAAADYCIADAASAGTAVDEVSSTATGTPRVLLAVRIEHDVALRVYAVANLDRPVVTSRSGKCQGSKQSE